MEHVDLLGHHVGQGLIQPDAAKVNAVLNWPQPKTKSELRSFLGQVGYYRKFVPDFSELTTSLYDLLKKNMPEQLIWNSSLVYVFNSLNKLLCSEPVLLAPNFSKEFKNGLGAVLKCPETLFISHENANFLFSVFNVVQGEAKTPKIMGCCKANCAFLHALKIGTFSGKWTLEWVFKPSHFVCLALYFLINSKVAFCLIVSQRYLAGTAKKKVGFRAQNSAKSNLLLLWLKT